MANAGSEPSSRAAGESADQPAGSPPPGATSPAAETPAVAEIVKKIQTEVRALVKGEVELAKSEIVPSVKNAGMGAGVFIGALYFILNAAILLFIAGALAIWTWWDFPIALSFVIMAAVLVVIAGILGLVGLIAVKKVKGPKRTVAHGKQTADAVKQAVSRGNAAASAPQVEAASSQPQAVARGQETG